jgi:hypothetical protein
MKAAFIFLIFAFLFQTASAQAKETTTGKRDTTQKIQVVETACGQCKLGLKGDDCDLAVRINGVAYFVDGTDIDSHGDAHATDGFCNSIRKAEVQGTIVNDRFQATYFKLLKEKKKVK